MSVPTILETIVAEKRTHVAFRKKQQSILQLQEIGPTEPPRGFVRALVDDLGKGRPAVIAEIKKASPSKGLIRADFNVPEIAKSYEKFGATCISCLTEEAFFQGRDSYLSDIKAAVALPVLRKDFIIDEYQVHESLLLGADCILLIAAILDATQMSDYYQLAQELGLDVLIEVHDAAELDQVLELSPDLVGINNRNLHTFQVSLDTTLDLINRVPENVLVVTESGIRERADVVKMQRHQVNCFLVGEAFMRFDEPGGKLVELFL
ncbi:MAG: indole-3-glycerol phosphate synthase TrpC [Pseudomonadales bacterium]|jgi:indole-3-glycerol phosphate synthase|nr:indole-3-glycerol phosphate synthase TrpC [Pseudomonadales bacterium]